ncbi:MAG: bestrophin family ion channel [Myxococcota bacterium]
MLALGLRIGAVSGLWAGVVYLLYAYAGLEFLRVPFLPIATVGTAVAFYVGFKNNASYDRFWEGRKIWGAIVNASRTWATCVICYVDGGRDGEQARAVRQALLYRHLAWVNALRLQLRRKSRFFDKPARGTRRRLERHAEHMRNDWDREIGPFLGADEMAQVSAQVNPATHLLMRQGTQLAELRDDERLDLFHQIAMMEVVEEFYALQGKCERIKNTPFPRQYAELSRVFTRVFTFLVPFGLLDVFADRLAGAVSTLETVAPVVSMVLASGLVTWVFTTMEAIGDASEDPFERSINDVPMNALCRTIEIDLRQMLGETEVPDKERPVDNLLY